MFPEIPIDIGKKGWEKSLQSRGEALDVKFWSGFHRISSLEIDRIEKSLCRKLPEDFKLFLMTFGSGDFPFKFGGGIFSPDEIIEGCAGPILMLVGSDPWASGEDQRRFYVSRGQFNPNPERFTADITKYADVDLLDLLQVGDDGMSCYYQLICPFRSDSPSGFCRITPEGTLEDRYPSFGAGLNAILAHFKEMQDER